LTNPLYRPSADRATAHAPGHRRPNAAAPLDWGSATGRPARRPVSSSPQATRAPSWTPPPAAERHSVRLLGSRSKRTEQAGGRVPPRTPLHPGLRKLAHGSGWLDGGPSLAVAPWSRRPLVGGSGSDPARPPGCRSCAAEQIGDRRIQSGRRPRSHRESLEFGGTEVSGELAVRAWFCDFAGTSPAPPRGDSAAAKLRSAWVGRCQDAPDWGHAVAMERVAGCRRWSSVVAREVLAGGVAGRLVEARKQD
jgi:hypothetical protein